MILHSEQPLVNKPTVQRNKILKTKRFNNPSLTHIQNLIKYLCPAILVTQ